MVRYEELHFVRRTTIVEGRVTLMKGERPSGRKRLTSEGTREQRNQKKGDGDKAKLAI